MMCEAQRALQAQLAFHFQTERGSCFLLILGSCMGIMHYHEQRSTGNLPTKMHNFVVNEVKVMARIVKG